MHVEDLHTTLDCLATQKDELASGYKDIPFSKEVCNTPLPTKFKISSIGSFERKIDPQEYLNILNDLMELHCVSDLAKYRCFW